MRYITVISLIAIVFMQSCGSIKTRRGTSLSYQLDSVYVTHRKTETTFSLPPYIYFYFSVKNNRMAPVNINIRKWFYDTPAPDRAYIVYGKDTMELFAGGTTIENFSIPGGATSQVTLKNFPPDLDKVYGAADSTRQMQWVVTEKFIKKLSVCIKWNKETISFRVPKNLQIDFNTLPDSVVVEWD